MYTAGEIITCPDWKITCLVGHVTRKVCVPWDKIYMPWARLNVKPWNFFIAVYDLGGHFGWQTHCQLAALNELTDQQSSQTSMVWIMAFRYFNAWQLSQPMSSNCHWDDAGAHGANSVHLIDGIWEKKNRGLKALARGAEWFVQAHFIIPIYFCGFSICTTGETMKQSTYSHWNRLIACYYSHLVAVRGL